MKINATGKPLLRPIQKIKKVLTNTKTEKDITINPLNSKHKNKFENVDEMDTFPKNWNSLR